MERLTSRQAIKHSDGTEHIETYCHGHRYGPDAFPQKHGSSNKQEYKNYCEMVDRLAAYEDAGLEPSEIPTGLELAKVFAAMQELEHLQQENKPLTLDELREMAGKEAVYAVSGSKGYWCVIDTILQFGGGITIVAIYGQNATLGGGDYGETWLAYRHKPVSPAI